MSGAETVAETPAARALGQQNNQDDDDQKCSESDAYIHVGLFLSSSVSICPKHALRAKLEMHLSCHCRKACLAASADRSRFASSERAAGDALERAKEASCRRDIETSHYLRIIFVMRRAPHPDRLLDDERERASASIASGQ
jgi:hypothetical protein